MARNKNIYSNIFHVSLEIMLVYLLRHYLVYLSLFYQKACLQYLFTSCLFQSVFKVCGFTFLLFKESSSIGGFWFYYEQLYKHNLRKYVPLKLHCKIYMNLLDVPESTSLSRLISKYFLFPDNLIFKGKPNP